MKKIVIAGEIYSRNQGDRLIYDNLAYLFHKADSCIQITALDISGRLPDPSSKPANSRRLARIRWAENHIPVLFSLVNAVWQPYLVRKRIRGPWRASLEHASALVIGGGQLLMDNQLGFPVKLFFLAREAHRMQIPVFITACGVGAKWSWPASLLFASILRNARLIMVRDLLSQERLKNVLPQLNAIVTFDPAIWSAEVYGQTRDSGEKKLIGIGVISHQDVNLHLQNAEKFSEESGLQFWGDIIQALHKSQHSFEIFTNGSPLDQQFAIALAERVKRDIGMDCRVAQQSSSSAALAQIVRRYHAVIAVRLHANILANAYQIPSIGLVWDKKVQSYYEMLGYPERCLSMRSLDPQKLVEKVDDVISQGFDSTRHRTARNAAFKNVTEILKEL